MGVKIDLKPGTDRRILGHVDQDGIQLETGEHVAINTIEINEIDTHHAPVVKPDTTIIYEDRIGETNYNKLDNLPSINSIVLTGNKTLEELGIQAAGDYATKDEIIKDASNINYEDNYGYGGKNVQEALDMAFATLDDKPNNSDLDNYVSYNTQSKTPAQQNQARKNIGAKKDIIELGVIDLSNYNDDLYSFMDTLVEDGEYHFQDPWDNFDYYLKVTRVGMILGQEYCGSEEGYSTKYFRSGYIDYSDGSISWGDWRMPADSSLLRNYAPKNHVHYTYVTTSLSIRSYLDANFNDGETRINSTSAKEEYRSEAGYFNTTVNGVSYYRRFQRYYSISEPWIIYSRFGLYNRNTKKINWNAWHVVEGVEE